MKSEVFLHDGIACWLFVSQSSFFKYSVYVS